MLTTIDNPIVILYDRRLRSGFELLKIWFAKSMTNGIESPIINLSSETARLTELPILIIPELVEIGGVEARRRIETDPRTIVCRKVPMAGDKLYTVDPSDVLLWITGEGNGVMMAISDYDYSNIRPLSTLRIGMEFFPERVPSDLIFDQPDRVSLIHIGRTNGAKLREIQEKAQVNNFRHISAGSPDDYRFNQWSAGYNRTCYGLSIFPQSGDLFLYCFLGELNL